MEALRSSIRPTSIKAVRPGMGHASVGGFGTGRVCAVVDCSTVLSVYNPRSVCWPHESPHRFIQQSPRTPASSREERVVLQLVRGDDGTVTLGRMPGPEPEPSQPAPLPTPPPQPGPGQPPRPPEPLPDPEVPGSDQAKVS
jgi:hypothetical protein